MSADLPHGSLASQGRQISPQRDSEPTATSEQPASVRAAKATESSGEDGQPSSEFRLALLELLAVHDRISQAHLHEIAAVQGAKDLWVDQASESQVQPLHGKCAQKEHGKIIAQFGKKTHESRVHDAELAEVDTVHDADFEEDDKVPCEGYIFLPPSKHSGGKDDGHSAGAESCGSESVAQEHVQVDGNDASQGENDDVIEIEIPDDMSSISSFHGETSEMTHRKSNVIKGPPAFLQRLSSKFNLKKHGSERSSTKSSVVHQQSSLVTNDSGRSGKQKEERTQRFAMALKAQLRPEWTLNPDANQAVPRWSQSSIGTILSIGSNMYGSESSDESLENTLRRGDNRSWFQAQSSRVSLMDRLRANSVNKTGRCLIHPHSNIKAVIDLIGIALMLYDFVTTPLHFFELPESGFLSAMGWITRIFWVIDIWINFHTATFVKGVLTTKFREIAKKYLRKMFVPDLLIVLGEWLAYLFERSTAGSNQSLENVVFLRVLKALRFAKVMRIFKLEQIISKFKAQINSTYLLVLLRPIVLIVGLLFFNHMIACFWYGIGNSSETGWISVVEDRSTVYLYFTSLHWAISTLHGSIDIFPQNAKERVFQCTMTIVALAMFSTLLSSITNAMLQIHTLRQDRFEQQSRLREVLARRHISADLTARIKRWLDYSANAAHAITDSDENQKIIKRLPQDLVDDLCSESRTPLVNVHIYFFMLGYRCPRILRQLCSYAMEDVTNKRSGETIFNPGDACYTMLFVEQGDLEYIIGQPYAFRPTISTSLSGRSTLFKASNEGQPEQLTRRDFVCEPVLWMTWEYCGVLISQSPVQLLSINAQRLIEVVKQFHYAHVNSARYALQFLDRMVNAGRRTDLALAD